MLPTDALVVAQQLTRAIESADIERLAQLYAPNAIVWHSTDSVEMKVQEVLELVRSIGRVSHCQVTVSSTLSTSTGFVQTQRNSYKFRAGAETSFHAALVATLDEDGRIVRLEEYLDSAGLAPLIAQLSLPQDPN
jgi:ketosteroid isomerase-like protein